MAHSNAMVLMRVDKAGLGVVMPMHGLTVLQSVLEGSAVSQLAEVKQFHLPPAEHENG